MTPFQRRLLLIMLVGNLLAVAYGAFSGKFFWFNALSAVLMVATAVSMERAEMKRRER